MTRSPHASAARRLFGAIVPPPPHRPVRRPRPVRLSAERLEDRSLLTAGDPTAVWAASLPVATGSSVLVKFTAGTTAAERLADLDAVGGRVVTDYADGPSLVALAPGADRGAALAQLLADPDVSYAEANADIKADAVVPNDPRYAEQWGLSMIDATEAWGLGTGTASTIVAVLDTGIDLLNTEFSGRVWQNTSASTRNRQVWGWNFVSNNGNVQDNNGHGTHVSGVLAAAGNNANGVAGVAWNVRIMPLKVLDSAGNGSTDRAVSAIYFAVNNGARVINASWGGDVYSAAMRDALNYANSRGVVFVTAAGNESSNNDVFTTYPASYRAANELVVAAVDRGGNLADYSNYGATTVDLAAPGTDILSTVPGGYATYTGTSMATPFVSGTVALLVSANPNLSAAQLVDRVKSTVKSMPLLQGKVATGGVVDPYYALLGRVPATTSASSAPSTSVTLVPNGTSPADLEAWALTTAAPTDPSEFVRQAFRGALNREPVASELSAFTAALAAGYPRLSLVRNFQATPEALRTRVARWYVDIVGWQTTVDAAKGDPATVFWANSLANGATDAAVLSAILSSAPYYQAAGGTTASYVNGLYRGLVARSADPATVSYYVGLLETGYSRDDVIRRVLTSTDARRVAVARLYRNDLGWTGSVAQIAALSGTGTLASALYYA